MAPDLPDLDLAVPPPLDQGLLPRDLDLGLLLALLPPLLWRSSTV